MVTSANSLVRVAEFYKKLVVGKEGEKLFDELIKPTYEDTKEATRKLVDSLMRF